MDTMEAFARGRANRGKPIMVFDWIKAARLIRDRQPETASAGLEGDWEWTGGAIYANGKPVPRAETYVYLASTWARPEIDIDGDIEECFVMGPDANGWDCATYWPPEAVEILKKEKP